MAKSNRHVVPSPKGGWDVKSPGSERASAHTKTQEEAIDRARQMIGREGGGELVIHAKDGQIRAKDTVPKGKDPRRTKG